ncbi:hypothetical protein [Dactylosporangium matsuzakiense]|uniref:Arc-like DNA binding domain-containing protein n=1 Tax=Dactylosporangium matsuzakiense TaxID=53360 RepID=A0A9W6KDX9_9ACTN|nr:hypothetical protein [Dactylosporangium matsuzakiense]UWZ50240.1 hypothetical protein Dmats_06740 [Dactylosporangium matsuzakiense]GLL00287.1 hypothetical protein GCM10017581_020270 [Dactylosporangium matsuzakiense]
MPERKKLLLRLDPQVYDAVARWAGDELRSVNSQIEFALRLALRQAGREPRRGREDSGAAAGDGADEQDPSPED